MTQPTKRQLEILEFIREHQAAAGAPPTHREIGRRFGIRSTNGVADHLRALERKGLLRQHPGRSRGAVPVDVGAPASSAPAVSAPLDHAVLGRALERAWRRGFAAALAGVRRSIGSAFAVRLVMDDAGLSLEDLAAAGVDGDEASALCAALGDAR